MFDRVRFYSTCLTGRYVSYHTFAVVSYLECHVHVVCEDERGSLLVGVCGFDELACGGGDLRVLRVVCNGDLLLCHVEDQLGDVLIGRLGLVTVITLRHFLKHQHYSA